MGTILASAIFAGCAELMEDDSNVTYLAADFLRWLNEGQRAVCIVQPEAYAVRGIITLTAGGVRHTASDSDVRAILEVYRNTNSGGTNAGRAVIQCDRQTLDEYNPNWQSVDATTEIKNWWIDERDPTTFWSYPPAHGSTPCYVEALLAKTPADVAAIGDAITLDDIYQPALTEWVMHRFTGRDSEDTPNVQRSQMHLQKFVTLVTGDASNLKTVSAKLRDQIK